MVANLNVGTHTQEDGWQTASEDEEEHAANRESWQAPNPAHAHPAQAHFQPNLFQGFSHTLPDSIPEAMQVMQHFQQPSHLPQMLQMPQVPQMMPMVMVPMPMSTESRETALQQPCGSPQRESRGAASAGPVSPGPLDRHVSSAPSEASDWASAEQASLASSSSSAPRAHHASARWTNRDCDWAIRQLSSNPSRELLQEILLDAWALASSKSGTRVVQAAMDVAEAPDKQLLTNVFKGRVWYALKSPHANHVLQKIIALMPPEKMHFVFEELGQMFGRACQRIGWFWAGGPQALAALVSRVLFFSKTSKALSPGTCGTRR